MSRCVIALVLLSGWSAAALAGNSLCATAEQAARVQPLYATAPVPAPFQAAAKLALPEAIVASAIPGKNVIGTTAAGFTAVWASLQEWDDATVVLLKAGQVFEVRGRIPGGAPSTKSQFYNLKQDGAGLSGHLRPDLVGAIYAVDLPGGQGPLRGVSFVDGSGDSIFGVFVPEGSEATSPVVGQFEKTRSLIAGLPRVCN
ncbi:MAG: ChuX/HutX family heme-like substrate-binding protein [Gammaproteobacteria bacterium]